MKETMKERLRKYRGYIIAAVVLIAMCIYFRPVPIVGDEKSEQVMLIWATVENGVPKIPSYSLEARQGQQAEIDRVYEIVGDYKMHRSLPKLRDFSDRLYTNGTTITLFMAYDTSVSVSSMGDVFVDNHRYKLDYFGEKKALELYARLEALMKALEAVEAQ